MNAPDPGHPSPLAGSTPPITPLPFGDLAAGSTAKLPCLKGLPGESPGPEAWPCQAIIEGFPGIFCLLDDQHRLVCWNSPFESLLQKRADELRHAAFADLVAPADREHTLTSLRRITQRGQGTLEVGIPTPEPGEIPHLLLCRTLQLAGRRHLLAAGFDITERRRAEQALRFSQERFSLAMEAANEGLWDWHLPSGRGYFSPRYCAMLGYEPEELSPNYATWKGLLHPDDRETADLELQRYLRGETPLFEAEFRLRRRSGEWIWILSRGRLIERDDHGRPVRVMGTHADISDRKRVEVSLRENEERLRLALSASDLGLYDLDLRTGEAIVTPEYARMLGYEPEEFRETNAQWRERLHPDDRAHVYETYTQYVTGQLPEYRVEFRQRTKQGAWRWILSLGKIVAWDEAGRPQRLLGTHADITLQKEHEARIARSRDELEARVRERTAELEEAKRVAEAASESKSRFLAMMSHEIRTPLNGVTGVLHLLRREPLTAQQRHWIDMADISAGTLLFVINDILDFSKIEAGKLALNAVPTDLRATIHRLSGIFAQKAAAKGLEWRLVIDTEIPTLVITDPDRLNQILGNLIGNAIKFTDHGRVALRIVPEAEVEPGSTEAGATRLRFVVTDTGPGLSEEQQTRLFQPFSQVDNSSTRRFGGTGLGLCICHRLVELMDGSMGVESEPGKGSTFWFEVPLRRASQTVSLGNPLDSLTPVAEVAAIQAPLQGRALLAEDNEINQELARELIQGTGCACECVANGLEAVRAAATGQYDLIFMDCMMPSMDGYEATRAIRAAEALVAATKPEQARRVPIIALTANTLSGDREKCLAAGMDDFLGKPLDPQEVERAIYRWLQGARPETRPTRANGEEPSALPSL